tara:strand:+ start:36372 stop:37307 length:936 start_codon:yes stop_codon:yes gene_type:complete
MKIALIGPGMMPIPPTSWGAVEILIWDYRNKLVENGHDVDIINTKDLNEIVKQANSKDYDAVHLHYDAYAHLMNHIECPNKFVTSHYPFLENPEPQYTWIYTDCKDSGCKIVALSEGIKNAFIERGCDSDQVIVLPNGVDSKLYNFKEDNIKYPCKSIYLAKIEPRKRQTLVQDKGLGIHFAGGVHDQSFNPAEGEYIGELTKKQIYEGLTEYANMVLLSTAEAHPVVGIEALASGLGLVLSEFAHANLDTDLPFITVIPEEKVNDVDYLRSAIEENRVTSLAMRSEIRQYAIDNFDWSNIMKKYEGILGK